jgi:hypothetical protein
MKRLRGSTKSREPWASRRVMFASPYPVDRQIRGRYFFVNGETTEWGNKLDALTVEVDDGAIGAAMLAIAQRAGLLPK